MRRLPRLVLTLALLAPGCVGSDPVAAGPSGADAATPPADAAPVPGPDAATPDAAPIDAAADVRTDPDAADAAPAARCDPAKDFTTPTLMPNLNTSFDEASFTMTRDELRGFLHRENVGAASPNILATRRATASSPFSVTDEVGLGVVNTAVAEYSPATTGDGLVLYFHRQAVNIGVHYATRTSIGDAFLGSGAVTVGGSALQDALVPRISADGQTLYWLDFAEFKLHSASRLATPGNFGQVKDASNEPKYEPVLSADELTLYHSNGTQDDIFVSTRATKAGRFGAGSVVASLSSPEKDAPLFLSHDGCEMVLKSTRPGGLGGFDLWVARRAK